MSEESDSIFHLVWSVYDPQDTSPVAHILSEHTYSELESLLNFTANSMSSNQSIPFALLLNLRRVI
jgi:hypothetical protein